MKREQVKKVITFANIFIKIYYNKSHTVLRLTRDNITYLRLYHKYKILDLDNRKLYYQKVDSF